MNTQAIGICLIVMGTLFLLGAPFVGRLPGDMVLGNGNLKLSLPLGTCLLLSVVFSIVQAFLRSR